jgi:predicted nucleotidyltransferase
MQPSEADHMTAIESEVLDAIVAWADAIPRIRRVWLFGSRAKGTNRPDSDINIAVEVEPVVDSEETLVVWAANSPKWKAQLQEKLTMPVDLEWFDPDGSTPKVRGALRESSVLIYERACVPASNEKAASAP